MFWWLVCWLISWLFRWPLAIKKLVVEVEMSDVRLSWTLPEQTSRQRAIAGVRIDFRVADDVPWTVQDTVPADEAQELLFVDVAPGTYFYQATVVDVAGKESQPAQASADVPFDAPSNVLDLVAAIE